MAKKRKPTMKADEVAAHDRAIGHSCAVVRSVIGNYLRHMRLIAELNQEDLGTPATISRMERGVYNGKAAPLQRVLEDLAARIGHKRLTFKRARGLAALYEAARYG